MSSHALDFSADRSPSGRWFNDPAPGTFGTESDESGERFSQIDLVALAEIPAAYQAYVARQQMSVG